jgi:hypothetical protein
MCGGGGLEICGCGGRGGDGVWTAVAGSFGVEPAPLGGGPPVPVPPVALCILTSAFGVVLPTTGGLPVPQCCCTPGSA